MKNEKPRLFDLSGPKLVVCCNPVYLCDPQGKRRTYSSFSNPMVFFSDIHRGSKFICYTRRPLQSKGLLFNLFDFLSDIIM